MTVGIIAGVLLMGMVGLIWMMLDIFVGDDHADDKRQEDASPDHHHRMHQPLRPSPALEKPEVMVSLPADAHRASSKRCVLESKSSPRGPGGRSDRRSRHPDGGDQRRDLSSARIASQARGNDKESVLRSAPIACLLMTVWVCPLRGDFTRGLPPCRSRRGRLQSQAYNGVGGRLDTV